MILVILLSSLIGLSLGLLGGGGSILAVPVLAYGAGLGAKEAIATSLLVVGATSGFALIPHAREGNVEWRTGLMFAGAAMLGAFGGGFAADWFEGSTLLLLFAAMMVVTSVAMFRGRGELTPHEGKSSIALVLAEGLVVGGATGLVGAGGGFLVVPALVLLGGMDMKKAVGTSLLVISLKSFAAFGGHASHVAVDFGLAAGVTVAAVVGTFVGAYFNTKVPAQQLRKVFAGFVLVMAGFVIWREAGDALWPMVQAHSWMFGLGAASVVTLGIAWLVRRGPELAHEGPRS